jgi:hypothetical protein
MFGCLVIVFPTSHEGGALVIRHRGQEWTFDSSAALSAAGPSSIACAAFFSDVEHEVLLVTSGHRVTLTYNLYFDDEDKGASAKDMVSEPPSFPQEENEQIDVPFETRCSSQESGVPSRWGYARIRNATRVPRKGHASTHLQPAEGQRCSCVSERALGLKPVLYLDYRYSEKHDGEDTVLLDSPPRFEHFHGVEDLYEVLLRFGGIMIPSNEEHTRDDRQHSKECVCYPRE